MITKRSSHIPTLTTSEMKNRYVVLVRRRLIQSVLIAITLQKMSAQ